MGFVEAIQSGFSYSLNWSGRASRPAYWWFWLFSVIAFIAAVVIGSLLDSAGVVMILYFLVWLALFLPSLSLLVRRMHDIGKSGWWILFGFFPFVGGLVLLVLTLLPSEEGENIYGPNPMGAVSEPGLL